VTIYAGVVFYLVCDIICCLGCIVYSYDHARVIGFCLYGVFVVVYSGTLLVTSSRCGVGCWLGGCWLGVNC